MKNTPATNAKPTSQPAIFKLTASGTFVERTRHISNAIARRAFELFEARGSEHGHDCEDWFHAESELLTPVPATVIDTDGGFTVRAELPGFTGEDVEVRAEPRRLMIYAKKRKTSEQEKGQAVLQETMSDEVFRVLELPHEIDPGNMTATVKNEVLEVILCKGQPGQEDCSRGESCLGIGGWEREMSFANDTASTRFEKLEITAPTSVQALARSD